MDSIKIRGLILHEKIRVVRPGIIEFYYNLGICPLKEPKVSNSKSGVLTTISCGKIKVLSFRYIYEYSNLTIIPKVREKLKLICEKPEMTVLYLRDTDQRVAEFAKIRLSLFPKNLIYFYNVKETILNKEIRRICVQHSQMAERLQEHKKLLGLL